MITQIGIVAGKILELLEQKVSPVSILEIKSTLDEPMDVINMSIGWLVRENYVRVISKENENYLFYASEEMASERVFEHAYAAHS